MLFLRPFCLLYACILLSPFLCLSFPLILDGTDAERLDIHGAREYPNCK